MSKVSIIVPKIVDFIVCCNIAQPCSMWRMDDIRKFDLKYNDELVTSEDYDLWSRCLEKVRLYNLQAVLLKYRCNPDSLVHTKKKEMAETDLMIKQRLLDKLTDNRKLQKDLIKVISKYSQKKLSFFEKIFSIRNEWSGLNKNKIIQILGVKIKIKRK